MIVATCQVNNIQGLKDAITLPVPRLPKKAKFDSYAL